MKKTNKESTGQLTWRLFAICLIAAVLLGATYAVTKDPIAEQDKIKMDTAYKETFPEADTFEVKDIASFKDAAGWQKDYNIVASAAKSLSNGKITGYVINMVTNGYNSGLKVTVGIGTDGTVKGVSITEHSESAGLGAKAAEPAFKDQFRGKSIDTPLAVVKSGASKDNEIQAITSSTITSKAVTNAVNTAVAFYKQYFEGKE